MLSTSPIADLVPSKANKQKNKYTYISTYSMGKIGIKKIIDNTFKAPPTNTDNKLLTQTSPINNITNNTNNNTNTNTNSNTNNNSSKNQDIQTSKKKLKNSHSVSPNVIHTHTKSASNNKYYYKNKSNQRINITKKTKQKSPLTHLKLEKKNFWRR